MIFFNHAFTINENNFIFIYTLRTNLTSLLAVIGKLNRLTNMLKSKY